MTPFLQDSDLTVYLGDVLDVLPALPAGSVDCVITSPPYWGLRDYGTAEWVGGDEGCDHLQSVGGAGKSTLNTGTASSQRTSQETQRTPFKAVCGKCGAERLDSQLGLEETPEMYVENMVKVFREIRRVLSDHGTVWLNLGDSYAADHAQKRSTVDELGRSTNTGIHSGIPGSKAGELRGTPQGLKPKDMVGIPWAVAFALRADGWWLRSDIIWAKPNPMPESITDRPTKSHEYVFLLTKQPRYFFDQEAVREPFTPGSEDRYRYAFGGAKNEALVEANKNGVGRRTSVVGDRVFPVAAESAQEALVPSLPAVTTPSPGWEERKAAGATLGNAAGEGLSHDLGSPTAGRNVRSVWEIATQSFPEAHFATYPQELVRRCLIAGCPQQVCRTCGHPRERIMERDFQGVRNTSSGSDKQQVHREGVSHDLIPIPAKDVGWSDCGHDDFRPGIVLDPFGGSGTTALVARNHGRHAVLVELNPGYVEMIATRLQQLSLLA